MQLDWFRQHHKKVIWVVAIVVIPSFVLFIPTGKTTGEEGGVTSGPSGEWYHASGQYEKAGWQEIVARRQEYARFFRTNHFTSEDALKLMVQSRIAAELDMNIGPTELLDRIRAQVKAQTQKEKLNDQIYQLYLSELTLSAMQFERLCYEFALMDKYGATIQDQILPTDSELFVHYCMQKQSVRLLYKELRSKDFTAQVEAPKADAVKSHYEKFKEAPPEQRTMLSTKARLSADVLYISAKEIEGKIKPTEEQLKSYYELYKIIKWKKDPKKGPDADNLKPFAEVKDEVLKDYVQSNLYAEKDKLLDPVRKAYREALEKAEAEKKPLDMTAFAKTHGLLHWRTGKLTRAEYEKGAEKEGAADFKHAARLFDTAEPDRNPEHEKIRALIRKQLQPDFVIGTGASQAFVLLRLADEGYEAARLMTLEEATPTITQILTEEAAYKKAEQAAKDLQAQWTKGENLPKPEELIDETCSSETKNTLARKYFNEPKVIGEVLEPTPDFDGEAVGDAPRQYLVRVGFAVDRKVPTWENFEQDFSFARAGIRQFLGMRAEQQLRAAGGEYLNKLGKPEIDKDKPDQPLFRELPPGQKG